MNYKNITRAVAAVAMSACLLQAGAQNNNVNITTSAVPFLRISPDARAGGLGDMGTATTADAASSFHNLAKTSFATQHSAIGANYTSWMHDVVSGVYLASLSGYHQLDEEQAIGGSLRYFNMGDFQVTDYSGNKLQTAKPKEFAIDFGYSRKLSSRLSLAAALRYISSNLASGAVNGSNYKIGTAVAADLSLYYHGLDNNEQGWTAGAVMSNLGTKISYTDDANSKEFIPANLSLGGGYTIAIDAQNHLMLGAELNKLLVPAAPLNAEDLAAYHAKSAMEGWTSAFSNGDYQLTAGAEYTYDHAFTARAGYHYADKAKGNQPYLTAGVGVCYQQMAIDFSYLAGSGNGVSRNPLSNTIRIGVSFGLDAKKTK
jgi:hypothetical protein